MRLERLYKIYFFIFPMKIIRYHRYRILKFVKKIAAECDVAGKKLLDIGAEKAPYKPYFKNLQYFAQDITQNTDGSIDYVGDINEGLKMIANGSFDYILCTQVLEHIKKPHVAFAEFYRILKPGGKLFLTTHLCFEEHMIPYDYFRFTKYGLKFLGESSGFTLEHLAPHGGIFQVIALIFDTLGIKLFFKNGLPYHIYIALFTPFILVFNSACYLLDFLDRNKTMTLNYECIYKKNL
jgi:SAM-dependent methyltransferase